MYNVNYKNFSCVMSKNPSQTLLNIKGNLSYHKLVTLWSGVISSFIHCDIIRAPLQILYNYIKPVLLCVSASFLVKYLHVIKSVCNSARCYFFKQQKIACWWDREVSQNTFLHLILSWLRYIPLTATQECALTGNWTRNPLVHRPALNSLSHTSQGKIMS